MQQVPTDQQPSIIKAVDPTTTTSTQATSTTTLILDLLTADPTKTP